MTYDTKLADAIAAWNTGDIDDEWQFQRLRDDCVGTMSAGEAFQWIDYTLQQLIEQKNEMTATEVLETVLALAIQSKTTEAPKSLDEAKSQLKAKFADSDDYTRGKFVELMRFYRG